MLLVYTEIALAKQFQWVPQHILIPMSKHIFAEKEEKYKYFSAELKFGKTTSKSKGDLFVCVEVLCPRQPNGIMSSVLSLPHHIFTGQA